MKIKKGDLFHFLLNFIFVAIPELGMIAMMLGINPRYRPLPPS